jgi:putative DNA primase/helicase
MRIQDQEPKLKLVAIAENELTREFFAIVEFRDIYGKTRKISIPRSILRKRKLLRDTLDTAGTYFALSEDVNIAALDNLTTKVNSAARWKYVSSIGWHGNGKAFVLPRKVIGNSSSPIKLKPPMLQSSKLPKKIRRRGTYDGWVKSVATPATFSSRMVFGICCSLSAPLLRIAKLNSFGVLMFSQAKAGKSTVLVASASVIGFRTEDDLPNFKTTAAAFGELPALFNDSLLPMNELSLMDGRANERHEKFRDLSYGVAEGRGKTYSDFVSNKMPAREWRCVVLANGEESADQIAERAGEMRLAGEAIRFVDLQATHKTRADVFDLQPCAKSTTLQQRADWARTQCLKIRAGCFLNHGVVLPRFIKHVIRDREDIASKIKTLSSDFMSEVARPTDGTEVGHLASYFAHVYAAGIIGIRSKCLPWEEKLVRKCVKRCYRNARLQLKSEGQLLEKARVALRKKLASISLPHVQSGKNSLLAAQCKRGFCRKTILGHAITIRPEVFKSWFDDRRQPNVVLQWLRSKNALPGKPLPPANSGTAIVWAESQPQWPDGLRRRSIVIELHGDVSKPSNI